MQINHPNGRGQLIQQRQRRIRQGRRGSQRVQCFRHTSVDQEVSAQDATRDPNPVSNRRQPRTGKSGTPFGSNRAIGNRVAIGRSGIDLAKPSHPKIALNKNKLTVIKLTVIRIVNSHCTKSSILRRSMPQFQIDNHRTGKGMSGRECIIKSKPQQRVDLNKNLQYTKSIFRILGI